MPVVRLLELLARWMIQHQRASDAALFSGEGQLRIIAKKPMATKTPMTPEAATAPHVPSLGLSQ